MDVLSQVLRLVHLTGAVLFRARLGSPWCVKTPPGDQLALTLPPPATHAITFHVILEGECSVACEGSPVLALKRGDVVVLAHGDAHLLGNPLQSTPVAVTELLGGRSLASLHSLQYGDVGQVTRILCGFLGCERAAFAPLFAGLPRAFKVGLLDGEMPALGELLVWAERETIDRRAGAAGVRLKMAELLFVEALRRYMDALPADSVGWLAGVRDPLLGRALGLLHGSPARHWDVAELARAVSVSRSSLADRFVRVIGEPPMQYLTRWRMQLAARCLRDGHDSVATIAEAIGYESAPAFQRAFKRCMGTTPVGWRKGSPGIDPRNRPAA